MTVDWTDDELAALARTSAIRVTVVTWRDGPKVIQHVPLADVLTEAALGRPTMMLSRNDYGERVILDLVPLEVSSDHDNRSEPHHPG